MAKISLPLPYPCSQGGIIAMGISCSATLLKYSEHLSGAHLTLLILFIIFWLTNDALFYFFKKRIFKFLRIFFLGSILFSSIVIWKVSTPNQKPMKGKSEIAINFSKKIESLLSQSILPKESQLVAKGLVLGSSAGLPLEMKTRAREGGILHLFAASGLHLGIFIGFNLFILKKIFSKVRFLPYIIALLFGFFYLLLLDFPVSFLRAYCFAVYSLLGSLFYRKVMPGDVLAYSSASIAMFLYADFLSVGFLLSFGAVFGIFYFKPVIDFYFLPGVRHFLKDNVSISLACSFATFPTLAYYFHSFSFGSFWINLFVVPLASLVLPVLYLNLICEWLIKSNFTFLFWHITDFILRVFLKVVTMTTNSFSFYYQWDYLPLSILIYLFFIFSLLILPYFIFQNRFHKLYENENIMKSVIIGSLITLFFFFYFPFGIINFESKDDSKLTTEYFINKGNSIIHSNHSVYLLGKCFKQKYSLHQIGKLKLSLTNEINLEDRSCYPIALHLAKTIQRRNGYLPKVLLSKEPIVVPVFLANLQSQIVRFDGDKKKLFSLLKVLKENETDLQKTNENKGGIIVLDLPPWSKEKLEDWKKYQKLLGISSYWKIMSKEELLAKQIPHTNGDPRVPIL